MSIPSIYLSTLVERLRSISFGGAIGAGLAGLFYVLAPESFRDAIDPSIAFFVGMLLGSGSHRLLNAFIEGRTGRFIRTIYDLAEAKSYQKIGAMSEEDYQSFANRRVRKSLSESVDPQTDRPEGQPARQPSKVVGGEHKPTQQESTLGKSASKETAPKERFIDLEQHGEEDRGEERTASTIRAREGE